MKVLFGGKYVGDFSTEKGLLYQDQEIQLNWGRGAPRRVEMRDLIISSRSKAPYAILGRYIMKPQ